MEIFQCLGLCELALLGCNAPKEVSSAVLCILYIFRNKELTSLYTGIHGYTDLQKYDCASVLHYSMRINVLVHAHKVYY